MQCLKGQDAYAATKPQESIKQSYENGSENGKNTTMLSTVIQKNLEESHFSDYRISRISLFLFTVTLDTAENNCAQF